MEGSGGRSERRLTPRHRLAHDTAEQIAAAADRLEHQAAEVRPTNKQLALRILKEATRLRTYARALDIQHKRAIRVTMERMNGSRPRGPANSSQN
jgi:hypothetical protein